MHSGRPPNQACELFDLGFSLRRVIHTISMVDFTTYGLDLGLDWLIQWIKELEIAGFFASLDDCLS
jgi:hypothetical protein